MSIDFKFRADASGVTVALKEVNESLQELSAADFAMGLEAVLGLFGKLKGAVGELRQMFSACTQAAAELEAVGTRLGVMLNDAASGDALAAALQRMATNGVVPLQELEQAAAALTQSLSDPAEIAGWVGVFADISAGSKVTAARLAEMTARLQDMGKAEFTELANAGIPIFDALSRVTGKTTEEIVKMSSQGQISTAQLLEAFKLLTAEGEKYHELNAQMSNTTGGSWDTLAASFKEILAEIGGTLNDVIRPTLQWVSGILQEHKGVFVEIVRSVMIFSTIWGGVAAMGVVKQLWSCVSAMVAMNAAGKGLLGIFRSIGKVGWILLITTAVEALMALYDKFFGSDKEGGEVTAPQEDFVAKAREQEERLRAENDAKLAEAARVELEAKRKEALEVLRATESLEAFNEALDRVSDDVREGIDVDAEREAAKVREEQAKAKATWEELQRREKSKDAAEEERRSREKVAAFKGLSEEDQRVYLDGRFAKYGLTGDFSTAEGMRASVEAGRKRAAEVGLMYEWNMLENLLKYVEAFAEAEAQRAEMADTRAAKIRELRVEGKRMELQLAGDEAGLAAFDDEQERKRLSAEYQAAGLSAQEADFYAGQTVARKRKLADAKGEKSGVQLIASSMASVGGGGVALRLGDAQLLVSRKQLGALEAIKEIVSGIAGKATGIPVVS